jgi:hypothetical protein
MSKRLFRPHCRLGIHYTAAGILFLSVLFSVTSFGSEQTLVTSMDVQDGSNRNARKSQIRVSQLAGQTNEMLAEYRVASQQLDRLKTYNNHVSLLIQDQTDEMQSMQQQLEDFAVVEQEIVPLMLDMIDSLEQFIALDVPFQLEERQGRVGRLRQLMGQADITVSEKYRQIMDAYQLETNFGRNIEAYKGFLELDGVRRQVDFLRVGRVLLAYQTEDREHTGFWNKADGQWGQLPDSFRADITRGMRIARKQSAPDLLSLPVSAAGAMR